VTATSLYEWQRGLIDLVTSHSPTEDLGVVLTRAVLRSWRSYRIETSAPLTLALLGSERAGRAISACLASIPSPSSFAAREGLAFLDHVESSVAHLPHAESVIALERALLALRPHEMPPPSRTEVDDVLHRPDALVRRHPWMAIVRFDAAPAEVMRALLGGRPLPAAGHESGYVLCSPRLPRHMREATSAEVGIVNLLDPSRSVRDIVQRTGAPGALHSLLRAGAVERSVPPASARSGDGSPDPNWAIAGEFASAWESEPRSVRPNMVTRGSNRR
jgi:hypothetical protein